MEIDTMDILKAAAAAYRTKQKIRFKLAALLLSWVSSLLKIKHAKLSITTDCGHECEWTSPYGWVIEAECPIHEGKDW
jgi:hypothetical protein